MDLAVQAKLAGTTLSPPGGGTRADVPGRSHRPLDEARDAERRGFC